MSELVSEKYRSILIGRAINGRYISLFRFSWMVPRFGVRRENEPSTENTDRSLLQMLFEADSSEDSGETVCVLKL